MRFPWSRRRTPVRADEQALDELTELSQEAKKLASDLTSIVVRLRLESEASAREHA